MSTPARGPAELLMAVVRALDANEIPHMLVGSFASDAYGANRTTYDIDMVIDPTPESLHSFTATFDSEVFYIGPSPQVALAQRDMFNVIDTTSGWKVDLIILKTEIYDRVCFERRVRTSLMDVDVWIASPEDTVVGKLRWAALGGSDRQVEDAARVIEACEGSIDIGYIERWTTELGLSDLLDRARRWTEPSG
jgi:hypothetical protein